MSKKKKFKETKVGAFLTEKAPQLVSQLGEFLPDQGGLGIVKNLISSSSGLLNLPPVVPLDNIFLY